MVGGRVLESRALPRRSSRGWVENFQVTIVDTAETPGLAVEVWDKAGGFVSPLLLLSGDRDSLIGLQTFSVYDLISLHIAKGKPKWYDRVMVTLVYPLLRPLFFWQSYPGGCPT